MSHLAGQVTVLGSCADLDVVRRIASVVARKERRVELVRTEVAGGPGRVVLRGDVCRAAEDARAYVSSP